jgi:hypothetical protein
MHTGDGVGSIFNPSDSQIISTIDYLNTVYNGTYPETTGAGNLQIQFALAKRTQNGSCTNGIERINASTLPNYVANGVNNENSNGCPDLTLKNFRHWNTNDYYNVWVVNKIDGKDGTFGPFIGGYALPPNGASNLGGIVMLATQMNSGQKTLPHEIGHALNLYHTFESSQNSTDCPFNLFCSIQGDNVCDTDPITNNVFNGVFDFTCRTGTNSCTGTPYSDNTEKNYMSYTNSHNLFTSGQKDRMQASMSLTSRATLVRSNNLALISPLADLTIISPQVSPTTVTAGNSVTLNFAESNDGNATATPNYVSFHLSSDNVLTPGANGDTFVGDYYISTSLAPLAQTILQSTQITIPANTMPGSYYLFFSADGALTVGECDETNNYRYLTITVVPTSCGTPSIPTSNSASSITQTSFQANWSSISGVDTYLLDVSTSQTFGSGTFVSGFQNYELSTISKIVTGVFCNTIYYYRVRSKKTCGTISNYSNVSLITTSSCGTGGGTPANDNCANAYSLTPNSVCNNIVGTVLGATASGIAKPSCDGFTSPAMKDVWYKFTANATGTFTINVTAQVGFDAVTSLYNGCSGTEIGCSDITV